MARHAVQIYEAESSLLESARELAQDALRAGHAAVLVCTPQHQHALEALLRADGFDVDGALARHQLVLADAEATPATFMRDGQVDAGRLRQAADSLIAPALASHGRVAAFGEMVVVLARRGLYEAALRLESLWDEWLLAEPRVDMLCAYPADLAATAHGPAAAFGPAVHAAHGEVIPTGCSVLSGTSRPLETVQAILASAPASPHPAWFYSNVARPFGLSEEQVARAFLTMEAAGEVERAPDDAWRVRAG